MDPYFQQLIDRLPLNVESLSSSKLGRIIKKLVKDEPSPGEYQFPNESMLCVSTWEMPGNLRLLQVTPLM